MKTPRLTLAIALLAGLTTSTSALAQLAPEAAAIQAEPHDVGRIFGSIGPIDYSIAPDPSANPPPALLTLAPADVPNEPNRGPFQTSIGRSVTVNLDRLVPNADGSLPRLSLPTHSGAHLELVFLHEERRGESSFSWFGQIAGIPASTVLIVREGDIIRMVVNNVDKAQRYEVRFAPARDGLPDRHVLRQFDGNPLKHARCGTCEGGCNHAAPHIAANPNDPTNSPADVDGGNPYGSRSDPTNRVDVMFMFTPEAATLIGGESARRAFAQSLADSFNIMANTSAIDLSVRVADANVVLNENRPEGPDGGLNLVQLTHGAWTVLDDGSRPDPNGVYDEALAWRNYIAADHICLIRDTGWNQTSSGAVAGVAWRPTVAAGLTRPSAVSVVASEYGSVDYIFAHELGHTFGACHDASTNGQAVCSPALTTYASGYVATVSWGHCFTHYYDLMAYPPTLLHECVNIWVPVFSNPNVIYDPPDSPLLPLFPPRAMGNANANVALLMNATRTTISAFGNASVQAFVSEAPPGSPSNGTYFNPFRLVQFGAAAVVPPGTDFGRVLIEPGPYNETRNGSEIIRYTNRVRLETTAPGNMVRLE